MQGGRVRQLSCSKLRWSCQGMGSCGLQALCASTGNERAQLTAVNNNMYNCHTKGNEALT